MNYDSMTVFQIREFGKGKFSVMARIWNPQKKFYEHPKYTDLSKEEAQEKCDYFINNPICVADIVKSWVFIGD